MYKIKNTNIEIVLLNEYFEFNLEVNGELNINFMQDFISTESELVQGYTLADIERI